MAGKRDEAAVIMLRAAVFSLIAGAFAYAPAHAEPLVDINWFGATIAEVRAARPDMAWVEEPNPYGFDELTHFTAPAFTSVGELPLDINLTVANGTIMSARLQGTVNVANAQQCETVSLDAARNFEQRLGALYWDHALSYGQYEVRISDQSIAIVQGWRPLPRLEAVPRSQYARRDITGFAIRARARPTDGRITLDALVSSDLNNGSCRVRVEIEIPYGAD